MAHGPVCITMLQYLLAGTVFTPGEAAILQLGVLTTSTLHGTALLSLLLLRLLLFTHPRHTTSTRYSTAECQRILATSTIESAIMPFHNYFVNEIHTLIEHAFLAKLRSNDLCYRQKLLDPSYTGFQTQLHQQYRERQKLASNYSQAPRLLKHKE